MTTEGSARLRRRLLPRPRRLVLTGTAGQPRVADADADAVAAEVVTPRASFTPITTDAEVTEFPVRFADDPSLGPGACRIVVEAERGAPPGDPGGRLTVLLGRDDGVSAVAPGGIPGAGRRRANTILAQLRRVLGPVRDWPPMQIDDAPAIVRRGVMLDVSRDRVPAGDALRARLGGLAALGFDHLQLYTEHTFAYTGCAAVWGDASPITSEEMRELDRTAAAAGVELAPNQNCFGHLHRWLRDPAFAELAETHDRFDFFGAERRGPFSLCPTDPRSLAFVRDRLSELVPTTNGRHVNIGCDETADVGTGRSRAAVSRRGKAAVERTFVSAVASVVRELGRTPMFWADMALRDPGGLAELPPELIALAWGYEDDARIEEAARTLASRGRPFWVCPGTSSWRSLGGRPAERRGNLQRAARAAVRHGAAGLLVTDWGDCGHRQPWVVSLHALGEAAALAWDPEDAEEGRDEAIAVHALGQPTGDLGPWLRAVGDVDRDLRRMSGGGAGAGGAEDGGERVGDGRGAIGGVASPLHNASALFEDLHPSGLPTALPAGPAPWRDVVDRLDALAAARPAVAGAEFQEEVEHVLETMAFAARRAAWRRDPAAASDPRRREELRERLAAVLEGHDRAWARDARPGGAADSRRWWTDLQGPALLAPP